MSRTLLALALLLLAIPASAHRFDAAFLAVSELDDELVEVRLKLPLRAGQPAALVDTVFPPECEAVGDGSLQRGQRFATRSWQLHCSGGLRGHEIGLRGLDPRVPSAAVALRFLDGRERIALLDRHNSQLLYDPEPGKASIGLGAYFPLGVGHMLGGLDHLLFVTGLLLVVLRAGASLMTLVATVTAFTLAHSLTLAASVLGYAGLPGRPVEALIALSILLLAVELAASAGMPGPPRGLTFRKPWLIAFGFGLIHGFGFAGALRAVGLPEQAVGSALLLFNLGVEAGQLLVVAALLVVAMLLHRLRPALTAPLRQFVVLGMGTLAAVWLLERMIPPAALAG